MLDRLNLPLEYSHADSGHQKRMTYEELSVKPEQFKDRKVVLMIRDPRDVVVSGYFQATKRKDIYSGEMSAFIRHPRHGIEKIIRFMNLWMDAARSMSNVLVIRYEDCHTDTTRELKRVLEFFGRKDWSDEDVAAAVEYARFENMRRRERSGDFEQQYGAALKAVDPDDHESFKTRRGKVGGFVDYLSDQDIRYCDDVMRELSSDYYP